MPRKRHTAQQKAELVILGLRSPGKIAELCREHGVHPSTWSHWKKAFLEGGHAALERGGKDHDDGLHRENQKLKQAVGSLYIELDFLKNRLEAGK